ncbi:MAG TPA: DUF2905 domain-containing protein [Candidatus Binataceae bacterium]|nr:DUF2905 domain-containing protein [Candidatus Binataceae bacterium]
MGKWLMLVGGVLLLGGAMLWGVGQIPGLGRLPGDIYIQRSGFTFYFPLGTCILISVLLSLLWMLFGR